MPIFPSNGAKYRLEMQELLKKRLKDAQAPIQVKMPSLRDVRATATCYCLLFVCWLLLLFIMYLLLFCLLLIIVF